MNKLNLQKNIVEQIKEAQIKLGFAKEIIRLYYPVASLCALLEIAVMPGNELVQQLEADTELKNTNLGNIKFALCKGERIEVQIPVEGAVYVNEHVENPPFLMEIIELFSHGHMHDIKTDGLQHHGITIEDICECFAKYNHDYVCEKMLPDTDFDYVLYFPNGEPDEWYYCVKFEMNHAIYHRFNFIDYKNLLNFCLS